MFRQLFSSVIRKQNSFKAFLSNAPEGAQLEKKISEILADKFPKSSIKVEDISGGCGAMFEIHIKSENFKGLSTVKQHQLVNTALKEEVKQMHGLRIFTEAS